MSRAVFLVVAALWVATGVVIFADPQGFYQRTPGVPMMGPFNAHFIRDAGLAFLASGMVTGTGAWRRQRSLALAGTTWPLLHACFHLQMWAHRGFPFDGIAAFDGAAVILPAFAAAALAWCIDGAGLPTRRDEVR